MSYPNLNEEKGLWKKGYRQIAGLDEAGRGPLAGPVVAAAVVIRTKIKNKKEGFFSKIRDSKKLTPKNREEIFGELAKSSQIEWGIGIVSEKIIDKINIKNAAELAMWKAVRKLKKKPDFLIIDGNNIKNRNLKTANHKLIIGADMKVMSCAMSSIIAKVTRDKIMLRYHKKYPHYGFDKHKGYPTFLHFKMLRKYRPCKIHRINFRLS